MNIFTALSDSYYPRLKVFARTLCKHNDCTINLSILYSDLSLRNRQDFQKFADKLGIKVRLVLVDQQRMKNYKLIHQVTVEAYNKLMVLDIYPTEERALWIDVDTVVLQSIEPFYNLDFENCYVAGAHENKEKLDLARLNLNPNGCYFNAGVILFNLEKIRKDFSTESFLELYEKHESAIRFADQDVVNIAFSSLVKRDQEKKYNYMIRSGYKLGKEEKRWIEKNVAIVHFIRCIKPWHYYYQGRARFLYLKEMFPIYPFRTVFLWVAGELYKLKKNKKTLENTNK